MVGFKRHVYGLPIMAWYRTYKARQLSATVRTSDYGFAFSTYDTLGGTDWEIHERLFIEHFLTDSDQFVDVGANHGFYTLLAAHRGIPSLSVEPDHDNVTVLRANLARNGFRSTIIEKALTDHEGQIDIYGDGDMTSLRQDWQGVAGYFKRSVPCTTLDAVLADVFQTDRLLIKIDVEGAEDTVLAGAARTVGRATRPRWIIESYPRLPTGGHCPAFAKMFDIMMSAGYRCATVEQKPVFVERDDVERWDRDPIHDSNFLFFDAGDTAAESLFRKLASDPPVQAGT